jgi:uncharacterized repeat protein (TIGR03847 family)
MDLGDVDSFVTGAIGVPGRRTFYVQATVDGQLVSVKCEKTQVAALGAYLRRLLDDLPAPDDRPLPGSLAVVDPPVVAFVLGQISAGYDDQSDRVVIGFEEILETDEEGEPLPEALDAQEKLRLRVTRGQALAFAELAEAAVAAGRPPCRWCQRPVDPDGHVCPRMN